MLPFTCLILAIVYNRFHIAFCRPQVPITRLHNCTAALLNVYTINRTMNTGDNQSGPESSESGRIKGFIEKTAISGFTEIKPVERYSSHKYLKYLILKIGIPKFHNLKIRQSLCGSPNFPMEKKTFREMKNS